MLALNYLGIVTASLGMLIFLPQIVKQLGLTNMQVGWVTMIPYICGAISMVVWGMLFDRTGERRWNLTLACVVATAGLIVAGLSVGTVWALAGMSIAAIGFYGSKGPFWSMPPMFLTARRLPRASRGSTHSAISAASLDPPSWAGSETRPAALPAGSMRSPHSRSCRPWSRQPGCTSLAGSRHRTPLLRRERTK